MESKLSSKNSSESIDDNNLMTHLKILADLPPLQQNKSKLSTQLKPPGIKTLKQDAAAAETDAAPFYGAAQPLSVPQSIGHINIPRERSFVKESNIFKNIRGGAAQSYLATSEQQRILEDLQEEFDQEYGSETSPVASKQSIIDDAEMFDEEFGYGSYDGGSDQNE